MGKDAEAYTKSGNAKGKKGDLDGAIADFNKAIELDPNFVDALYNRGIAKERKGDLDGAIADFDKAIELDPNCAPAYNSRGTNKAHKKDFDGAIADFNKAIELKSNYADAYSNRGLTKDNKEDFDGALADYDKAIEFKPRFEAAFSNRGVVKGKKGDLDGAIADFNEAIKIDPRFEAAFSNRGIVKFLNGNLEEAEADFDQVIELDSNNQALAYHNRGIIKIIKEELDEAIKDFNKAIRCYKSARKKSIPLLCIIVQEFQKEKSKTFFQLYLDITKLRREIAKMCKKKEVMHFTNLDTLRNLAKGNKFRLFNSSHMHDNTEGQIFFDLLDSSTEEKLRKAFSSKHTSNIFIGSFILDSELEKDSLMWRLYGKHAGKESAGCLVFFDMETMPQSELINSSILGDSDIVKNVRKEECILYPVIYSDGKSNNIKDYKKDLREIGKNLDNIIDLINKSSLKPEGKEQIQGWAGNLLNEVRFLFKHESYKRECEVRFVIDRKKKMLNDTKPEDAMPERTYVECPKLKIKRVVLGPAVERGQEWKDWLSNQEVSKDWEVLLYGDSKKARRKPRKK